MRKLVAIIILVGACQILTSAQTLIDEYGRISSDDTSGRLDLFASSLRSDSMSNGFILISFNEKLERVGDVFVRSEAIKEYLVRSRGVNPKRLRINIVQSRDVAYLVQLWKYPEGIELPKKSIVPLDIKNLKSPYLYTMGWDDCEPTGHNLSDSYLLVHYAETLKKHPKYLGLIIVRRYSFRNSTFSQSYREAIRTVIVFRDLLVNKHGVESKRIKILIRKSKESDAPGSADFYILPSKKKSKNKRLGAITRT